MADSTSSPAPTCDVDGTCYCPLTGVIDTLSQKYAMQLISIIGAHESLRFGAIEGHLERQYLDHLETARRIRGCRTDLELNTMRSRPVWSTR